MMKDYEVTVIARLTHFFPAESEEQAREEMLAEVPDDFMVDDIEVIEL